MKRALRYLFGVATFAFGAVYGYQSPDLGVWGVVVVLACIFGGPLVAFGPEIYGAVSVDLPDGSGFSLGDDDCNHDGGK